MHIKISGQVLVHKGPLINILFHLLWLSFSNDQIVFYKKTKMLATTRTYPALSQAVFAEAFYKCPTGLDFEGPAPCELHFRTQV